MNRALSTTIIRETELSQIVAVANQKGGVGKTTTTVSLAAAIAKMNQKVLIIDADPQSNASSAIGFDTLENSALYDSLLNNYSLRNGITSTTMERVSIVPSAPELAGVEVELVSHIGREYRMQNTLESLREEYDLILIDCPPSLGLLTVNALTAADSILIPVQCEYFALEGLKHLSNTIELIQKNLNPKLKICGILLTMYDARTNLSRDVESEVRAHFNETFNVVIPRSVRLSEAPSHGTSVLDYDPESAGAVAYIQLAEEFLKLSNRDHSL